jgi:mannose-6-phosphate isomerase-like protein (cupin superfamily)
MLGAEPDAIAPDGSEIRLLLATGRTSVCHCTLPAGRTTLAVRHRTVEEIWFFLGGTGEVWRRDASGEEVLGVGPGTSLEFQFRATGEKALTFVIATMPPWPGAEEAVRVADHWPPDIGGESPSSPSAP